MAKTANWTDYGARSATRAESPRRFIDQQLTPLFFQRSREGMAGHVHQNIFDEKTFWKEASSDLVSTAQLWHFTLTDWFPRSPGTFWSRRGVETREMIYDRGDAQFSPELGRFYTPASKMGLIENGGIGSIRLRPRKIDGEYCWLATAITGTACHAGIPLAVPETLLRRTGIKWGECASLIGRIRFLQDANLNDIAENVQGIRPLILFVEDLLPEVPPPGRDQFAISPVVLFDDKEDRYNTQFTFAQCHASDSEIDLTVEWMEHYADRFSGRIITNFDEQRPILAAAPLSYQRLVTKTYDRAVINHYGGTVIAERIDTLTYDYSTHYHGAVHMGDNITASDNATIINRSSITNSSLTINSSPSLSPDQKSELTGLVKLIETELAAVRKTHADEAKMVDDAVNKAVVQAAKPAAERKKPFLELTATGLLQTAKLLADVAPGVVHGAGQLATFLQGLV
jgi:hypothetical protein